MIGGLDIRVSTHRHETAMDGAQAEQAGEKQFEG